MNVGHITSGQTATHVRETSSHRQTPVRPGRQGGQDTVTQTVSHWINSKSLENLTLVSPTYLRETAAKPTRPATRQREEAMMPQVVIYTLTN